jgi:hypothetical protein
VYQGCILKTRKIKCNILFFSEQEAEEILGKVGNSRKPDGSGCPWGGDEMTGLRKS